MTTILILVVSAYVLSSLAYLLQLTFAERKIGRWAFLLLSLGFLFHIVLLAYRLKNNGYPFILNESDVLASAAWGIVLLFLLLKGRYPLAVSGTLFAPFALLLLLFSWVRQGDAPLPLSFGHPWGLTHLLSMSLALAIFAVSFLVGLTYLFEEFQLKTRRPGKLFPWLPSLETMDLIHYRGLTVGFVLLSIGIISGAALTKMLEGQFFKDPRQITALVTWVLYASFLNIRMKSKWRGRKGILLSLLGFVGVILAFLALEHRMH